ncbi:uncharacterized protein LOC129768584 [Toxorhynchites rutilus septentrionalis]|uniref:uncharacterized protein LOC129768584 n=1 Tax=Toxorhynchites rutilus septentrionalis TaxID=329112 RepID=UPI00247AD21E|nr:uncharacterized protein LOC129768584 [Toxorhynchites rutilus septentrionalis]
MAIRRFISRRGSPSEIYSDNGTNFQGASRELREQIENLNKNLGEIYTNTNTKWIFNPPSAPHFGGIWERLVKSVKQALGCMLNSRNPDDETLLTALAEAESVINSRPLTYLPLDSAEQEALTPNHFILLSSDGVIQPPKTLGEATAVTRGNWNLAQQMTDRFWSRWVREYIPTIAKRTKWFQDVNPPKIGDVVVVVNEGVRNGWVRGRIASIAKGQDGRMRQALIQTASGFMRRPTAKVAVLAVKSGSKAEPEAQHYVSGNIANAAIAESTTP